MGVRIGASAGSLGAANSWTQLQTMLGGADIRTPVGFYGAAPVARSAAYTLTYAGLARVLAADTAVDPANTAATQATPWGYTTQAQADAIRAAAIALHADLDVTKNVLAQLIADLKNNGLMQ
jgi:hypothetical protein